MSKEKCPECEDTGIVEEDGVGALGYVVKKACPRGCSIPEDCPHCRRPEDAVNHVPGHIFVGWGHGWQPCPYCGGTTKNRKPVCSTCNDTHQMTIHGEGEVDRVVMCTQCPVPCQRCRAGGNGPYCEKTPCDCACHAKHRTSEARASGCEHASHSRKENGICGACGLVVGPRTETARALPRDTCPTCGSLVRVSSSGEGTSHYVPINDAATECVIQHERVKELEEAIGVMAPTSLRVLLQSLPPDADLDREVTWKVLKRLNDAMGRDTEPLDKHVPTPEQRRPTATASSCLVDSGETRACPRRESPLSTKALTQEQLVVACRNIGYDLTCGACALRFFTGFTLPTSRADMIPPDHEASCRTDISYLAADPIGEEGHGPR